MSKIEDKIKGLSIELDKSVKLNELDQVIEDFKNKTDDKYDVDVFVDVVDSKLHLKRIKKSYIKLVTVDGEAVENNKATVKLNNTTIKV